MLKNKVLCVVAVTSLLCNTCSLYTVRSDISYPRARMSSNDIALAVAGGTAAVFIPLIIVCGLIAAVIFYDWDESSEEGDATRDDLDDLNDACQRGDVQRVRDLLDTISVEGDPIFSGHTKLCITTLHKGKRPIYLACESGNVNLVRLLLRKIGTFNLHLSFASKKRTILHAACRARNPEVFKCIVNEKIPNVNNNNIDWLKYGSIMPLHIACACGRKDLAQWLIEEKGANIEAETRIAKDKPILFACKSGNKELVRYFIEDLRANIHEPKGQDDTEIEDESWRLLMAACESGNLELVQWLVNEKGFDVNISVGRWGGIVDRANGPLAAALKSGKVHIARWLVEEKQVDMRASRKVFGGAGNINNLLIAACKEKGDKEVAEFLVEKGADIRAVKNELLKIACQQGKLDLLKYIVEDHNITDLNHVYDDRQHENRNNTLLHFACKKKKKNIVKYLLEKGARVDMKNRRGNTPFHVACHKKDLESVKLLVEKGANIHEKDWLGHSQVERAMDLKIEKFLEEKAKEI